MATATITVRYFAPSEYRNLTIHCNSCLKESYGCIYYILLVVVCIDEHDIDSIDGYEKTIPGYIRSQRVNHWSVSVVTYVRCRCQETTRLSGSDSGCVTISHMILNRAIWRYEQTHCVVQSSLKHLMISEKC
jgi:hypothetical protein